MAQWYYRLVHNLTKTEKFLASFVTKVALAKCPATNLSIERTHNCHTPHWHFSINSSAKHFFSVSRVILKFHPIINGMQWCRGMFCAWQPEGRGFKSTSSHWFAILDKLLTHNCLRGRQLETTSLISSQRGATYSSHPQVVQKPMNLHLSENHHQYNTCIVSYCIDDGSSSSPDYYA